jgi:hypothetical protein
MESILPGFIQNFKDETGRSPHSKIPRLIEKVSCLDASNFIVRSVLAQPYDDPIDHPNVYSSRKLNKVERNYSTTKREALSMIFSL